MAKHRRGSAEEPAGRIGDEVDRNLGGEYWSVDDCAWTMLNPTLPENLVDLLAPPIVVGAVPLTGPAAGRAGVPGRGHPRGVREHRGRRR
ncbi:hypothetical protein ACFFWC_29035 [Plantactinospora siamensis]|uniref:Uncharacterized protein n=1 Tax=Plantactinospora siamensis TaxID=555372 RepID=A0ABV6NYB0_9ACTN